MADMPDTLRFGVIMAGGAGERFWPLSRKNRPKQLLRLTHPSQSMLGEAVERLTPLIPAERILVVTGRHLVEPIRKARVGVPDENVIAEPCKRNTSGALAYAAAALIGRYPDRELHELTMAVCTADHRIGEPDLFRKTVDAAMTAAEKQAALVTCGIVPTRPETGFGYIDRASETAVFEERGIPVYEVGSFHEKPNRETAEQFLASGDYFWNSGMFFWTLGAFIRELRLARPKLAQATLDMGHGWRKGDEGIVAEVFEGLEDISIDYALMEHARHVLMAPGTFPWDDVGLWPALATPEEVDVAGNLKLGDPVVYDSRECIVINEPGSEAMAVGVVGVDNLVVVVTEDGVLVVPKDRAEDVREIVTELKSRGASQL